MNAVTSAPSGAPVLTDAMVKNIPLLRIVGGAERPARKAAFAALAGKDASNANRAMKLLTDDGVITGWDEYPGVNLTPLGARVLAGMDVIDGRTGLPQGYAQVRHSRIAPHPLNPRKDFSSPQAAEELDALRQSILEHGVRYPLEVRPAGLDGVHHIISGERRWRAVGLAIEEGDLPEDHEVLVVVKPVDDEAHLVLALEENIQRSRLTYTEEAGAYAYFVNTLGWDPGDVGDKFGRGRKHVQDYLRLLTLPPEVLEKLDRREIRYREARAMFQDHRETPEPEPQLFDAEPLAPAVADPGPRLPELSAKEALVLAELVDKADRVPAEGLEPGWTAVAETPADKVSEALIRRQMLAFRSRGPESYARAMIHSSGVKAWLEVNGFYEGVAARAGLLQQLRADAKAEVDGGYSTQWLNPVPEGEAGEAQPGSAQWWKDRPVNPGPGEEPRVIGVDLGSPAGDMSAEVTITPAAQTVAHLARLDAMVVSQAMKDVNDRLAGWRIHTGKPHWTQRKEAELEAELLAALEMGALLDVLCLLTVLRDRSGAVGGCRVLTRAVEAYAEKVRES